MSDATRTRTRTLTVAHHQAYAMVHRQLLEVIEGKRGFVSLAEAAKRHDLDKTSLIATAEGLDLHVAPHGRYGYCASRKLA